MGGPFSCKTAPLSPRQGCCGKLACEVKVPKEIISANPYLIFAAGPLSPAVLENYQKKKPKSRRLFGLMRGPPYLRSRLKKRVSSRLTIIMVTTGK